MPKIEIEITQEQKNKLLNEIKKGTELNLNEETFSGYSITLNVIEGGISWLNFKMYNETELGDVSWKMN
ncbi:hypothetical protein [Aequorivita sediminis]|uniref:hypothetical protein n=1 Tax=Aequorivita sediminis TaxID=3073653 RepID=UPI0028B235B6|nr:hypothetical protein [Aequorivita sp. F6058]